MGHEESKNDKLREGREGAEERRQELRDELSPETTEGEQENLGSQDERRKEGSERH